MEIRNILQGIFKQQNINISIVDKEDGLKISFDGDELSVCGSSNDLLEFANYLINVALSNTEGCHLHIDDVTLVSSSSEIKNIIIEKK